MANAMTEDEYIDDGPIQYPSGFRWDDIVACGNTGMVCLDKATQTVVKSNHFDNGVAAIDVEARIYERIEEHGGHPNLLRYYGRFEHGIRLEYMPNFNSKQYVDTQRPAPEQILRWAAQISDALRFLHSLHVIHGDVNIHNVLFDAEYNAKLVDFAGSSLDGSPLLIGVTHSHQSPTDPKTIEADLFAFGSLLYRIATTNNPYHELSEREVETRFKQGNFPSTVALGPIGTIIQKCWLRHYSDTSKLCEDIHAISNFKPSEAYGMRFVNVSLLVGLVAMTVIMSQKFVRHGTR